MFILLFHPLCRYPHDELNHLSYNEARNYYGGVVSVIPVSLDLLKKTITDLAEASTEMVPQTTPEQQTDSDKSVNATENPPSSSKSGCTYSDGWKPAWKPPGHRRMLKNTSSKSI